MWKMVLWGATFNAVVVVGVVSLLLFRLPMAILEPTYVFYLSLIVRTLEHVPDFCINFITIENLDEILL